MIVYTTNKGVSMLVTIDKRGSINLPSTIRKDMGLDVGTRMDLEVLDGGAIMLTPVAIYPTVKLSEKGLKKLADARKSGTVKMPTPVSYTHLRAHETDS